MAEQNTITMNGSTRILKIANDAILTEGACQGNTAVEEVILPATIHDIPAHCFDGCIALKKITVPTSVTAIGEQAFRGCSSLQEIRLSEGLKQIGTHAFEGCASLTKLIIPGTVTQVGDEVFAGCTELTELVLSEGITRGYKKILNGFPRTVKLKVTLPGSIRRIGQDAFSSSYGEYRYLSEIILCDGIESIGDRAFYSCMISKIYIPSSVRTIGASAFCWCSRLRDVKLSEGIEIIGDQAFEACSFSEIRLPCSLKEIGEFAFGYGTNPKINFFVAAESYAEQYVKRRNYTYQMRTIPTTISQDDANDLVNESACISGSSGKKSVNIPNGIKTIDDRAFANQNDIGTVTFPASLHAIGERAFSGCNRLSEFHFNAGITTIKSYAFYTNNPDCPIIERLEIPSTVKTIAKSAFEGRKIREIVFHDGITYIGARAFYGCQSQFVELPATVQTLAPDAFGGEPETMVSLNGKMPGLDEKRAEIAALEQQAEEAQMALIRVQEEQTGLIAEYKQALENTPDAWELTVRYYAYLTDPSDLSTDEDPKAARMEAIILYLRSAIEDLSAERKRISFFRFSERKTKSREIKEKKHDLQVLQESLQRRYDLTNQICDSIQASKTKCEQLHIKIDSLQKTIQDVKTALVEKESNWKRRFAVAQKTKERAQLVNEKGSLLSRLIEPTPRLQTSPKFTQSDDCIVEEMLLNKAYKQAVQYWNQVHAYRAHADFQEQHVQDILRVRVINRELKLDEFDGIEAFREAPKCTVKQHADLPERFARFTQFYANDKAWHIFVAASAALAKEFSKEDPWNTFLSASIQGESHSIHHDDIHNWLFSGVPCIRMQCDSETTLQLFPYCAISYRTATAMSVMTYSPANAMVTFTDKTELRKKVPADGEQIAEHKMYLNADGSPDKRRKENPTVKVIRYTTLELSLGQTSFTIKTHSYEKTVEFANAFNAFVASFQSGDKRALYNLVLISAPDDEFDQLIREQEERKEQKRLEAEAKARAEQARLEQERLDAQKAAEERKAAALRRQQELVEERRRQREESARIQRLFGSDENIQEESKPTIVANDEGSSAAFAVVGKRSISNNTFKIILKQQKPVEDYDLYAYFVDSTGRTISNKKRVPVVNVGEEFPLGFVLTACIDYTKMTACTFRIASATSTCADIGFEMHIAFFSDF